MIEDAHDTSSINAYLSSYHKLTKADKFSFKDKVELPAVNAHIFIKANLNLKGLKEHIAERENQLSMPIFTFHVWNKLKAEVKIVLKKMFHQRLREVNEGRIIALHPGESISLRADCFCLSPHIVYTILIPLEKCEMNTATIAISESKLKWQAQTEQQLFYKLQETEFSWFYTNLQEGDMVIIGRDCIYGSFRNDGLQSRHFVEMRWVKHDQSSSSSNSS